MFTLISTLIWLSHAKRCFDLSRCRAPRTEPNELAPHFYIKVGKITEALKITESNELVFNKAGKLCSVDTNEWMLTETGSLPAIILSHSFEKDKGIFGEIYLLLCGICSII